MSVTVGGAIVLENSSYLRKVFQVHVCEGIYHTKFDGNHSPKYCIQLLNMLFCVFYYCLKC